MKAEVFLQLQGIHERIFKNHICILLWRAAEPGTHLLATQLSSSPPTLLTPATLRERDKCR